MPISSGVCRFQPGSVKSGGTWQVGALRLAVEDALAARAAAASKLPAGGFGASRRELVEVQRRAASAVIRSGSLRTWPKPVVAATGNLLRVVEPRVVERALPVHLEVGDERVPVRDRAPARVGVRG